MSWFHQRKRSRFSLPDLVLVVCQIAVAAYFWVGLITPLCGWRRYIVCTNWYLLLLQLPVLRLINELTRRMAGLGLGLLSAWCSWLWLPGRILPGFWLPGLSVPSAF